MSVYNRKHDVLFVHIPRTAGTSMERRGFLGHGGHYPMRYFEMVLKHNTRGIDYDKVFKFAFVRNPFDRLVSFYFSRPEDRTWAREKNIEGFSNFVKERLLPQSKAPIENWQPIHIRPQWWFITGFQGEKILADFVGKFENLERDWNYVCQKVGVDNKRNHYRKSDHKHYREYYTEETKGIVYKIYKKDFEFFDYAY